MNRPSPFLPSFGVWLACVLCLCWMGWPTFGAAPSDGGLPFSGLQASDGTFADHIALLWQPVDGATHYEIYRSNFKDYMYAEVGTTLLPEYQDRALKASRFYYYKVRACYEGDCGPFSSPVLGSWAIGAPSGVTATQGTVSGRIGISWQRVPRATLYYVYRSLDPRGPFSVLATVYHTTYDDLGARPGLVYYYRIRALTTSTGSDWSKRAAGYQDATLRIAGRYCTLTEGT